MKNFSIKEHSNLISKRDKYFILSIIKKESRDSILSKMSDEIIMNYLDLAVRSNKIYVFSYSSEKQIIGYAILADKPKFLISEFYELKNKIFFYLLLNFRLLTILDLFFSILKFDMLTNPKKDVETFNQNLNLNLIAISGDHQSKGHGSEFLEQILQIFKDKKKFEFLFCETFSKEAEKFYMNKFNFTSCGKKFRTSGILKVLQKKL